MTVDQHLITRQAREREGEAIIIPFFCPFCSENSFNPFADRDILGPESDDRDDTAGGKSMRAVDSSDV